MSNEIQKILVTPLFAEHKKEVFEIIKNHNLDKRIKNAFEWIILDNQKFQKDALEYTEIRVSNKEELFESPIIQELYKLLTPQNQKIFDKEAELSFESSISAWGNYRGYRTKKMFSRKVGDYVNSLFTKHYFCQYLNLDYLRTLKNEKQILNGVEVEYDFGYSSHHLSENRLAAILSLDTKEGNDLFDYIKRMIYDNENIINLDYNFIRALVISSREGTNELLLDLLKAAKLSEGLRQAIVENIDRGTLETFKYFLSYIQEENLIRFASVKRAFLCYTYLEYENGATDSADKIATWVLDCLLNGKNEEYLQDNNPFKVYAALYAIACNELQDSIDYCLEKIQSVPFHNKTALLFFMDRLNIPLPIKIILELLDKSEDFQLFIYLDKIKIQDRAKVPLELKKAYITKVCALLKNVKIKDLRITSLDLQTSSPVHNCNSYMKAYEFAYEIDDLYELVYPLYDKFFYSYYGNDGLKEKIKAKQGDSYILSSMIALMAKNFYAYKYVQEAKEHLTKEHYLLIANEFKSKRSEARRNINTLLSSASDDIIIECATALLKDKNEEKRKGGISLIKENFEKIQNNKSFTELKTVLESANLPTEVANVRDSLLLGDVAKKDDWFFDIDYTLPKPSEIAEITVDKKASEGLEKILFSALSKITGKKENSNSERLYNLLLSALNKITAKEDKKITIKLLHACFDAFSDIYTKHEGEEVDYYLHSGVEKKKIGFELNLGNSFPGKEYSQDYRNYPFSEEYLELIKDVTNEEFIAFWIFSLTLSNIFGYSHYISDSILFTSTVECFKHTFSYDLSELKEEIHTSEGNLKKQIIHLNNYITMMKLARENEAENTLFGIPEVEKLILDYSILFLDFAHSLLSDKSLAKKIDSKARKVAETRTYRSYGDKDEYLGADITNLLFYKQVFVVSNVFGTRVEQIDEKTAQAVLLNFMQVHELLSTHFKEEKYGRFELNFNLFLGLVVCVQKGIVQPDYFYKEIFINHNACLMGYLYGAIAKEQSYYYRNNETPKHLKELVKEFYYKSAEKILEIELERSESETPFSSMAQRYCKLENAEIFVKTVHKLGKTPFTRGYCYSSGHSLKDVFSTIITNTSPEEDFTAEKYKDLLKKYKISDTRLLEASMYNLKFIPFTEEYLGIKGLAKAAYYFRAHMNESCNDDTIKIIRRYSDIEMQDFTNGQMDLNWFKESYAELGEKEFAKLYNAAKYITDGGKHKRAQYFADAVLDKLKIEEVEARINDKRNQEMLLAYGLIPFAKDKLKDAIKRYKRLQLFLKESKQFGAQKKASEALKVSIAMNNLARNYGFKDSARFSWNMETELYQEMIQFFTPKAIDDIEVYISLEDVEKAKIIAVKGGKELKSVPAKYNKNEYVLELKEAQKSLREQFKRARVTLENVMIYEDELEFEELQALQKHPIISSLLQNLLFISGKDLGFVKDSSLVGFDGNTVKIKAKAKLRIAHPVELLENGTWANWQEYLIKEKIIQPFKQVFREVYTPTADELKENGISRRFAGYQIEKSRAMGVLKTRSWLINESQGFEKINHKDNIRIDLYCFADWFMPSEIESPSIEKMEFINNKTHEKVAIKDISKVLYSETMRDMDLVVSVAYVGGVDPMLNQSTMEMRKRILEHNLELFKITNYVFDNNHIMIKGTLHEYSLHLGSGIIHTKSKGMLPVFPVHSQQRGHIFLPFIDSDPKTSEIISKVLMLAEDNKIKDPSVLQHLR